VAAPAGAPELAAAAAEAPATVACQAINKATASVGAGALSVALAARSEPVPSMGSWPSDAGASTAVDAPPSAPLSASWRLGKAAMSGRTGGRC
jgi:hypothetical protein